jgi:PEP-CTERM motif
MRRSFTLAALAVAALMAAGSAYAQGVPVANRSDLSGPTIDWGVLGPEGTNPGNPFTTSAGIGTVTGSTNGIFHRYDAASGWNGGFSPGDHLLYTSGSNMTFDFSSPIFGFGTQTWYDIPPSGDVVFTEYLGLVQTGTFTYTTGGGNACNCNQATFFGIMDNSGFDRVVLQTLGSSGTFDFAINDVTLEEVNITPVTTPEPASLLLFGTGLTSLAGVIRRRRKN